MYPKHPPGSDLMAKLILRDPAVIDIIVTTVVGPEARSLYTARPTEWPNDTKSDVVYAASVQSASLPPVLVELCLHVKKDFKTKPLVVVFGVDTTRNDVSSDLEPTSHSFIKQIPCKYWAEKCYILDRNTIADDRNANPLPPLLALSYFFSSQKLSLISTDHRQDPTLQSLFAIAQKLVEGKVVGEELTANVLIEVCEQTNIQFKKIMNVLEAMPETVLKKRAYVHADDGALYTHACKRLYSKRGSFDVEPMPPPPELPEPAIQVMNEASSSNQNTTIDRLRAEVNTPKTDLEYVKQYKQTVKTMDWKLCFEAGKKDGFFSIYNSHASLKTAFYKRNK